MKPRQLAGLVLLGAAAWLALVGDKTPAGQASPVRTPAQAVPAAAPRPAPVGRPPAAEPLVLPVTRELWAGATAGGADAPTRTRDLFSARSWAPPAAAAAPPPPPIAPPVPFAFLGKKLEDGAWEVYLSRADHSFVVREGSVLEGTWRVDRIEPPSLTLTYLPLTLSQTLAIGDTR